MKVLEYDNLSKGAVLKAYRKVVKFLEQGDFHSAEVKKLPPTNYYRAKLDHTNRLLFRYVNYAGDTYILALEIIHQHAYHQSRFLNGATIQESKILFSSEQAKPEAITYINPKAKQVYFLDKLLSFDDLQQEIYHQALPLMIIGSAGSGKTALTLEKMKHCTGDVLYVTHSSYLAKNAYQLYYSHDYAAKHQEVAFLSYDELIDTTAVPSGAEMTFKLFQTWMTRYPHKLFRDAHKFYEEIKGVITGNSGDAAYLSREAYLSLGVKQSIYLAEERPIVYDQFEKYLRYLQDNHYYDLNILSHAWLARCDQCYDYIVIDEVQDFTTVQLLFILKQLRYGDHFMLSGDANQIVHPNFFSWSKIKTLFYQDEIGDLSKGIQLLRTNYRNSPEVTYVANRILKIKNASLGSVDKASHALITSQSDHVGHIYLMDEKDAAVSELNTQTKGSTDYAVIVLRDEMKSAAKYYFQTPLVFSVHEAKGLEYPNIIIYNAISSESEVFSRLIRGIIPQDLEGEMVYRRSKDKRDRSLEIYKFYINALYVAITRSITTIYWIEQDVQHPMFPLLQLNLIKERLRLAKTESSIEVWQKEARKLELQGKQEQADAIREQFVQRTPSWTVLSIDAAKALYQDVVSPGDKRAKANALQLCEYAGVYKRHTLLTQLSALHISAAKKQEKSLRIIEDKYYSDYSSKNPRYMLMKTETYGMDFRNPFNQTPLMAAIYCGNIELATCAIESGANTELFDGCGQTPLQQVLAQTIRNKKFRMNKAVPFIGLLQSIEINFHVAGRLVKIQSRQMEFFLYHFLFLWLSDKLQNDKAIPSQACFSTDDLMVLLDPLPERIMPDYRKKRRYLSAMLAKNETYRSGQYNRQLFLRIALGRYILNPALKIQTDDGWVDIYRFIKKYRLHDVAPYHDHMAHKVKQVLQSMLSPASQTTCEEMVSMLSEHGLSRQEVEKVCIDLIWTGELCSNSNPMADRWMINTPVEQGIQSPKMHEVI